jgi:hypothetical protein
VIRFTEGIDSNHSTTSREKERESVAEEDSIEY